MKTIKAIIKVVWPIIYSKLSGLAEKTESKIDDYIVVAVNEAIQEWLNDKDDE